MGSAGGPRMGRDALARVLAAEGIDSAALDEFCLSPDGARFRVPIPQAGAGAIWRRLRAMVDATGYWPVLTLGYEAMGWTEGGIRAEADLLAARAARAVVAEALRLDVPDWLAERQSAYGADEDDPGFAEELAGAWPDDAAPNADLWILSTPLSAPRLELQLVPTTVAWQVPAFFTYGGSSAPEPSEHVAVLRAWHQRYGAEPVTIAGDTIEMAVARPPRNTDAAWALAWAHFAYCPDVVIQGTRTVGNLAAQLLDGATWYFWWD